MKKNQHKILHTKLDKEEQEISDAFDKAIESGQLKSIPKLKEELAFAKKVAANFSRKDGKKECF